MASSYTARRIADGFDRQNLALQNIRDAYVLRLPFRLRVGKMRRFVINVDGPVEIWCRNTISIPKDTQWYAKWARISPERFNTEVLLLVKRRQISPDDLEELKKDEPHLVSLTPPRIFEPYAILTEFLNAYRKVGFGSPVWRVPDEVYGVVEPITLRQFDEYNRALFAILSEEDYALTNTDISQMFRWKTEPGVFRNHWIHALHDLPDDLLSHLPSEVEKHQKYVFYEFASIAWSRKLARDLVFALIMAVTALEGAHAAFVRVTLKERAGEGEQKRPVLTNHFLRNLDLQSSFQMTCHLLMETSEKPSTGAIEGCAKAVEIRNAIMHTLADSNGQYGTRKYTESDLDSAFRAVMEVYSRFVAALERRLES